jgi:hypothetical protein
MARVTMINQDLGKEGFYAKGEEPLPIVKGPRMKITKD